MLCSSLLVLLRGLFSLGVSSFSDFFGVEGGVSFFTSTGSGAGEVGIPFAPFLAGSGGGC